MRRRALDAASRAGAPIAELVKLYDTTTDPTMKQTLIGIYIRNGEQGGGGQAAVDREGRGEHLSVRRSAISQLSKSDDPRIKQALQDIVMR